MTLGNWLTIAGMSLGIFLAVYAFFYTMDKRVTKLESRCENHQVIIDSIAALNQRLDKLGADNEMFWRILGPHLAGIIHSPKAADRDKLVDKLVSETITEKECAKLTDLLIEAINSDRWSAEKKLAGALLLARAKSTLNACRDDQYRRSA